MTPADPALLDEAVALVRAAGDLTLEWFRGSSLAVERKGDGTPVTDADRAAERYLREEVERRYPDDTIIGEEESAKTGTSDRTWIIDPIDGTKAFTRGIPLYCNLLAIDDAEGPLIGVVNMPAIGETVYAGRGIGCFFNGEPCSVSDTKDLGDAYLSTSSYSRWPDEVLLRVKAQGPALRTWGDGYGYSLVARGRIDAMVDPTVAVWDVAPLPVILAEAGGRFTAWNGEPDVRAGSGLATNGILHDELLRLVNGEG